MPHIMIDLETMGTRPDAPIIAIGAVMFDHIEGGGKVYADQGFYVNVDLQSAVTTGAKIDPSTVMWWLQQSKEARAAFDTKGVDLVAALDKLDAWFDSHWANGRESAYGVWGNGASFDNVILAESYKRLGMTPPWPFWKDRCYRTVKSMYPEVKMERSGTHHNALDDAISQAKHLIEMNRGRNFLEEILEIRKHLVDMDWGKKTSEESKASRKNTK